MQEYKRLLHRKKIIDENLNNRKKDLLCPICNSENRDVSKFCENCGSKLVYSFINYL